MPQSRTLDDIRVDYEAPDNVPKDRIVDLSFANGSEPNDLVDPYEPFAWLNGEDIPRLLYNPPMRHGLGAISGNQRGNWVVSHYADIERVYTDNDHFSNAGTAEFQRLIGETFKSIPLAIDPPDHQKYRLYLMPYFSPARITRELEPRIRKVVVEMIDAVAGKGEVDMAWDFGRVYPVRIFMGLMGFPEEMFEQFLDWEWEILHSGDLARMQAALRGVLDFLRAFIAEKEREPDDHLVSAIVHGRIGDRAPTEDEKIGMVWFLWLGGLDTVAATIAQMFRRMALQPEIQRAIRERPELINGAVEEFLRTQPILSSTRTATKDFEWHGVQVRKGDSFQCLNPAGNFDPARFDDPRKFDPERKANRHFTFVGGVHICLGAHLARRELRVLLEEWFNRIPEFRAKPGADTTVFPGLLSIRNLPLVWDAGAWSSRT
ncbi:MULTISPECIES: cytochrome P450 [Novosphingobium]|uniref:cytochrome P450 n=1 Tax=Novosphingobium TaxID=165696 RepID=UPI0022F29CF8|nr:cytochrome P450 [Novosphingobium resinovorum]GLK43280.1 cytochrome P450 [Novosphingobium resinovorum]